MAPVLMATKQTIAKVRISSSLTLAEDKARLDWEFSNQKTYS